MRFLIVVIFTLMFIGCNATETGPIRKKVVEDWKPDAEFASKLSSRTQCCGFTIQPPVGYTRRNVAQGRQELVGWQGPSRDNGTRSSFSIAVATPPPNEELPSLDIAILKLIQNIKNRRSDWQESGPSYGQIGGIDFVKKTWSGIDLQQDVKLAGVIYVALVDGKVVQLSTQDLDPQPDDGMKLAEASIRTFGK
jgi:hypothetical protein